MRSKRNGEGCHRSVNPRPPRCPSEHIGRDGREKQEEKNQVKLVGGSVYPNLSSEINCTCSVERGVTPRTEMDVPGAVITSYSGRIEFYVVLGTEQFDVILRTMVD